MAVDFETGPVTVLLLSGTVSVSHLESAVADGNMLYLADLFATGSPGSTTPCGVIYHVSP